MRIYRAVAVMSLLFAVNWIQDFAQDNSWLQFEGRSFNFQYPPTWQLHRLTDRDAVVADTANPVSVEFAVSDGTAVGKDQLAVGAQNHVDQFAQSNGMIAKYDGWTEISDGVIRVISHVCADKGWSDMRHCPPTDQKAIDVSSVIYAIGGRIVLIEMMHKPGMSEARLDTGRKIVLTFKLLKN